MINLKLANKADLSMISQLAEEIWREYYPDIVSIEQIDYMLGKFYSKEALEIK